MNRDNYKQSTKQGSEETITYHEDKTITCKVEGGLSPHQVDLILPNLGECLCFTKLVLLSPVSKFDFIARILD